MPLVDVKTLLRMYVEFVTIVFLAPNKVNNMLM